MGVSEQALVVFIEPFKPCHQICENLPGLFFKGHCRGVKMC